MTVAASCICGNGCWGQRHIVLKGWFGGCFLKGGCFLLITFYILKHCLPLLFQVRDSESCVRAGEQHMSSKINWHLKIRLWWIDLSLPRRSIFFRVHLGPRLPLIYAMKHLYLAYNTAANPMAWHPRRLWLTGDRIFYSPPVSGFLPF